MALLLKDLFNSPYSGVFCATNDSLTLIPPGIPEDDMEAISEAEKEDIVVLFGKGDESTQELNGVYLPFSDKEVAKKILRSLG